MGLARAFASAVVIAAAATAFAASPVASGRHRHNRAPRPRALTVRGGAASPYSLPGAPRVLVTGGAGYIGSHTCLELITAGARVVVVDNLSNSNEEALRRVSELTGCAYNTGAQDCPLEFRNVDLLDAAALEGVFEEFAFDACIHFAGKKAVGESVAKPLMYYQNNIAGTNTLLELLGRYDCKRIVFSSSATVYGDPESLPIREDAKLTATNPYGRTKLFVEEILRDVHASDEAWRVLILRYFNPIGAHESGRIGEDPLGIPNNLMPFIAQVCVGRRDALAVFGDDYDTPDGTGVRDYIHVVDLSRGHVAALAKMLGGSMDEGGCMPINLGTGNGVSVLDLVGGMAKATGKPVPYNIAPRRPGDIASCWCDPACAKAELGWEAEFGVEAMCDDTWRWQGGNPNGYVE